MTNKKHSGAKAKLVWFLRSALWIIPILFVLDIVSKLLMERLLEVGNSIVVIPHVLSLTLTYNKGAAWGIFAGMDWLLITFSVVCGTAMLAFLVWKYNKLPTAARVALYLMIPGAFGNLIDRAFYENGVIDFLEFTFMEFPIFNLADSYLVIGVFVLIIGELIIEFGDHNKDKHKRKNQEEDSKALEEAGKKLSSKNNDEDPLDGSH